MTMDRALYDFPPGTVIVVGPKGRLALGENGVWEMFNCQYYGPHSHHPELAPVRDLAWREFDDAGKRIGPDDGKRA